jgi:hypothetical protein
MSNELKAAVESRLRAKTDAIRQHLHILIDKIDVHDFRVEGDRVVWSVSVPPTLLTLVRGLLDFLSPPDAT